MGVGEPDSVPAQRQPPSFLLDATYSISASANSDAGCCLQMRMRLPWRQGFHQVLRYANDYNQSLGYLVIFNCSNMQLVVTSTEATQQGFPPRINYGSKTFFVITIDIHPHALSASRENPATRRVVKHEDLTRAE